MINRWLIVFQREPWWAEFWAALAAVLWGGYSIYVPSAMEDRPQLGTLTQIASGHVWEISAVILGVSQIIALVWNERLVRWGIAIVACWWWSMHFYALLASDAHARAVVFYLVFAMLNLLSVFRLLKVYR